MENVTDERAAVVRSRRAFAASPLGSFVRALKDAVAGYLTMRADGVEREDALKGLEAVVRDEWPRPRQELWHFVCAACEDTGWEHLECRVYARCERSGKRDCALKGEAWAHPYVVPCACPKGDKYRKPPTPDAESQLAAVGRRKKPKPRGFTQVGR